MQATYIMVFLMALVLSAVLTPLIRQFALRTMVFVQRPKAISIETHVKPIPAGGGLAIFVGVVAALWIVPPEFALEKRLLMAGAVVVFLGLLDDSRVLVSPFKRGQNFISKYLLDNRSLSVPTKFLAQFLVAYLMLFAPGPGQGLAVPQLFGLPAIDKGIAFVWLVGMMNALNFLDIMDGLAAGASAIAALGFCLLAGAVGEGPEFVVLPLALMGAAVGFLFYNFNPARIFMGDAGSQFLGLVLGTLALRAAASPSPQLTIFPPLVVLGIPLFEITFTMGIRALTGKAPWKGSKDHYPLRMFQLGLSVRQIVLMTYAIGLVLGLCAVWIARTAMIGQLAILAFMAVAAMGISLWLGQVKIPKVPSRADEASLHAPAAEILPAIKSATPQK